ncbi:MAG: endopeptidase La [Deltaproteobacteria bacterium]|jgi:ATP-dependent Lon protease|nr:endopeptidase La [Deltaproteobacteria bacterium]
MKNNDVNTAERGGGSGNGELTYELDAVTNELPDFLNLLPMAELNSFPGLTSTISVDEGMSREVVRKSAGGDGLMALFPLKTLDVDTYDLKPSDFYPMGVAVRILQVRESDQGALKVSVQGVSRIAFTQLLSGETPSVRVIPHREPVFREDGTLKPLVLEARRLYAEVLKLIPGLPVELFKINNLLDGEPVVLADLIMASLPLKNQDKAEYLMIQGLKHRYLKLLEHLTIEVSNRKAGQAISRRIEQGLDRRQKELHLREQLKAIKAELGEDEGGDSELLRDLYRRLRALELPEAVRLATDREMDRLNTTPPQSAEYGVIRGYLEWIADLPWNDVSDECQDLARAREILDRDHYGLEKVKRRILEFLAVHKLTSQTARTPILCLTGPPGVGKTSLARSIAECLGRKFVRLSLGGLKDEAEIRGHRRTYVGSRPGRLISEIKRAGVANPVFLLDELDKMGSGVQGDPAAALLEALDPEQNETFTDHYLEVPFDLSKVLFVLTANVLEHVPGPLRDRLEIIEVDGYSLLEKTEIAARHLWPRELGRHGLEPGELQIPREVMERVITLHTWEAGVRELARSLSAIARSRSIAKAEGAPFRTVVTASELKEILGTPIRRLEAKELMPQTGVVAGLAWTAAGGDIMFIEAVGMPGRGHLTLTGKLGEVMRESAQAAISFVRSRGRDWNLDPDWFARHDIHLHLPHGAIPKDGPSAGVGIAAAAVSLASGRRVRSDVAVTGEISLRGLVLPVGGLKEKLLAASRAGISTVIVPAGNAPDLEELPEEVTGTLDIVPVKTLDQVIGLALLPCGWERDSDAPSGFPGGLAAGRRFERGLGITLSMP